MSATKGDGWAQACYHEQERQLAVSAWRARQRCAEMALSWDEGGREAKNCVSFFFMENGLKECHRGDGIMFKK